MTPPMPRLAREGVIDLLKLSVMREVCRPLLFAKAASPLALLEGGAKRVACGGKARHPGEQSVTRSAPFDRPCRGLIPQLACAPIRFQRRGAVRQPTA